ncbi:SDR family NAD(P)-dependent oxidoreductase [Streptomyces mirabilis]|nr:SDR family NAD(P)-dependent oxidoreductase [Streptomyces mirabilis]
MKETAPLARSQPVHTPPFHVSQEERATESRVVAVDVPGRLEALGRVRSALLASPSVQDCLVLPKLSCGGELELLALVVPREVFQAEAVSAAARSSLPAHLVPRAFVPVSCLPTGDRASVQTEAARVPLLDEELLTNWQQHVDGVVGSGRARVRLAAAWHQQERLLVDGIPAASGLVTAPICAEAVSELCSDGGSTEGRLSVVEGDELSAAGVTTLPEALLRAVDTYGDQAIVHLDESGEERRQTYMQLLTDASRAVTGLRKAGVAPGEVVLLQLADSAAFMTGLWACLLNGSVPVPLAVPVDYAPDVAGCVRLEGAIKALGAPWVLVGSGHEQRLRDFADASGWNGPRITPLDMDHDAVLAHEWHRPGADEVALMLLTSGSTGVPKAVMLRHRNVLASCVGLGQQLRLTASDVVFNWMPLDHVGGVVMMHLGAMVGGRSQIQAPMQAVLADPLRWLEWMDRYGATVTWAPSFAFGLANDRLQRSAATVVQGWDLSRLRVVLNGGEAVGARVARRFLELLAPTGLPGTAMRPIWGMTETSSGSICSDRFQLQTTRDDDLFVEVGRPIPGMRLRVTGPDGTVVPEGTTGLLQVSGAPVTNGYYGNADADAFTEDGWFSTGDLAFVRRGQLTITGRAKDVIIVNGVNYHSQEIESVIEELPCVERSFTAACQVRVPDADSEKLAIFLHLRPGTPEGEALRDVRRAVQREVGVNPDYLIPVGREEFVKTGIGEVQRAPLRQRFEAGAYDAVLQRIDLLARSPQTLPSWFYRPVWVNAPVAEATPAPDPGPTLVFLDSLGLGEGITAALTGRRRRCVQVTLQAGARFQRRAADHYLIDPGEASHYQQLLRLTADDGLRFRHVLYLGHYALHSGPPADLPSLERGARDALAWLPPLLAAVTAHRDDSGRVVLRVVGAHSQQIDPADQIAGERAALLGLLKSAPLELPWLRTHHLDLPLQEDQAAENVRRLLREIDADTADTETAYRGNSRLVRRLEPVNTTDPAPQTAPLFTPRGLYVLTGGLGGVGVQIARHLLTTHLAKILLLGRTPLAPADAVADSHPRLTTLRELQALGSVRYATADVCDEQAVRHAIKEAEEHWGQQTTAILHLAGRIEETRLVDTTADHIIDVLAPKAHGAWAISRLLKDRPQTRLLLFSSLIGYFGAAMYSTYAAANAYLDSFAEQHNARSQQSGTEPACQSLLWSPWDQIGMSRGYQTQRGARARGYHAITPPQALASLRITTHRTDPVTLIGIDPNGTSPRAHLATSPRPLYELVVDLKRHPEQSAEHAADKITHSTLPDRYGTPTRCRIADTETALSACGADDTPGATSRNSPEPGRAPRTGTEQTLAAVWADALGRQHISADDNFFDLGGTSLAIAGVHEQLCARLGRHIRMAPLFRSPTLAALARTLDEEA